MKTEKEIRKKLWDEEQTREVMFKYNVPVGEIATTRVIRALKWVLEDDKG